METSDPDRYARVQAAIIQHMGMNRICLLSSTFVANLKTIAALAADLNDIDLRRRIGDTGSNKLADAFRNFLQVVAASVEGPVVLLLDDLQWSDSSSMITLRNTFKNGVGVMVIGCYRSNEVDDQHDLAKAIQDLKQVRSSLERTKDPKFSLSITELEIGNLDTNRVSQMLSELLYRDCADSGLLELSKLVHSRTNGNAFFVRVFLSNLVEKGMLKFHIGTFQWDWNIHQIETETSATDNLVDLIHSNVSRMDDDLLKLASTLGCTFDKKFLWEIWNKRCAKSDSDEFDRLLLIAIEELCLVATNCFHPTDYGPIRSSSKSASSLENTSTLPDKGLTTVLRFSHDKIQEAVISLMAEPERIQLQQDVGKILLDAVSNNEREGILFVIVNLLNGSTQDPWAMLATLNLEAALKAQDVAAFSAAAMFVQKGLMNIPIQDMWTLHRDLAIELHSLGARAQQVLGDTAEAERYCSAILNQSDITPHEKCAIYNVKLDLTHNAGCMEEGLDTCLKYLHELGCSFPKYRVARQLKVRTYIDDTRSRYLPSRESIRKMKMINDPVIMETLRLLERAGGMAYVNSATDLYILIRCHIVRLIGKHGLFYGAPAAYASFAVILMHLCGEIKAALELADFSLAMDEMTEPSGEDA